MREYKLVMLGSGGVGKSALTIQFIEGVFVGKYNPTIEDCYRKEVEIDDTHCMLEILDTAGTEQFTAMRDLYMENGEGFVLVYSITSQATFNDLLDIKNQIMQVKDISSDIPLVLVGNKCDLEDERVVGRRQGESLARSFGCPFIESSAKSQVNVHAIFFDLVRQINRKTQGSKHAKRNVSHDQDQVVTVDNNAFNSSFATHDENRTSGHVKDCCVLL